MGELLKSIPSGNIYSGEKYKLGKEALKSTIDEVKQLNETEVSNKLKTYKDSKANNTSENTFEMIALYQRALQLLGKIVEVDALFGPTTFKSIRELQSEKLGLKAKSIDGLPGPITTYALIDALGIQNTIKIDNANDLLKSQEKENQKQAILEIKKNVNNPSKISSLNSGNNLYNGKSLLEIDYAVVEQNDGEFFLFDKPNNGARNIYRTDGLFNIKGISTVTKDGIITKSSGDRIITPYMPTPKFQN